MIKYLHIWKGMETAWSSSKALCSLLNVQSSLLGRDIDLSVEP